MRMRAGVAAGHHRLRRRVLTFSPRRGRADGATVAMMLVSCAAERSSPDSVVVVSTVYDAATAQVRCLDFFFSVPWSRRQAAKSATDPDDLRRPAGRTRSVRPRLPCRYPRRSPLPVAEVGSALLGTSPPKSSSASYGTPFPAMPCACPAVAAAMCVGEGVEVYQRLDGSYLQAGDPLRHPDHHRAYELMLR